MEYPQDVTRQGCWELLPSVLLSVTLQKLPSPSLARGSSVYAILLLKDRYVADTVDAAHLLGVWLPQLAPPRYAVQTRMVLLCVPFLLLTTSLGPVASRPPINYTV